MQQVKVAIVGSGFAGLCMGIQLKKAGIDDFVILEKASSLGGTWRENTYPGAECDIPSALYSYSFEPNHKWAFKWSGQKQILKYQHDTAVKYGLEPHLRFNSELKQAVFDDNSKRWLLTLSDDKQISAQHFVPAVGQLHHPLIPEIEGQASFAGAQFHSAQWNHSVDLNDKRVVVIGNAASAVQFIPEIAPLVKQLFIFQRSANWMIPKVDRAYRQWEQKLSAAVPLVGKLYRFSIWCLGEWFVLPAIKGNPVMRWATKKWSLGHLAKNVSDMALRKKLVPDYPIGAKRILFSDTYYPVLNRDNVELVTACVERINKTSVEFKVGEPKQRKIEVDIIIYATGFKTNPFLAPINIVGLFGQALTDAWKGGATAYLGLATSGFPNMHILYGPNTNLGHSSIIIMIEAQVRYVLDSILELDNQSLTCMDVKSEYENAYNKSLQSRLSSMVFNEVEDSWYKDSGKITNNWAGGTLEYQKRLRHIDWSAYQLK